MHIPWLGGTKVQTVLTYFPLTYAEPLATASIRVSSVREAPARCLPHAADFRGVVRAFLKLHKVACWGCCN